MYVFSCIFTIFCAIVLPLALTVVFCVRKKESWKPILLGSLTFVVFQVLIRIPLLRMVLPETPWFVTMSASHPVLYALFLGLTAALFEEGGRYIVISLLLKKQRTTLDGVAFGLGHGGIEAILLAGINAVMLLIFTTVMVTPDQILAGGVERLSTIVIQIAFSVMVMKSVREKKIIWLSVAFVIHTLLDFSVVLVLYDVNIWAIESAVIVVAVLMAWFVVKEYKKENSDFILYKNQEN